jgi:hypothetical protein
MLTGCFYPGSLRGALPVAAPLSTHTLFFLLNRNLSSTGTLGFSVCKLVFGLDGLFMG